MAAPGLLSLRSCLMLVLLLAALPTIIIAPIVGFHAIRIEKQARIERLGQTAHNVAAAVDHDLARTLNTLEALARSVKDDAVFQPRRSLIEEMLGSPVVLRDATGLTQQAAVGGAASQATARVDDAEVSQALAHFSANPQPGIKWGSTTLVGHQFDTDHETFLPDLADTGQIVQRGKQAGEFDRLGLNLAD